MASTDPPTDLIVKFNTPTDGTTEVPAITSGTLTSGIGINFNLQIVEKGWNSMAIGNVVTTVIGSSDTEFNTVTSQELANLITKYLSDKSILSAAAGTGSNIRSMKLIVNVDPTA